MGTNNKKPMNGLWCVLVMGLLLVATAQREDCIDRCKRFRGYPQKYSHCVTMCDWDDWQPHLKRFAGGAQVGEARGDMAAKGQKKSSLSPSICDNYCWEEEPDADHDDCVYRCNKTPRLQQASAIVSGYEGMAAPIKLRFSAGEGRGAMVAKGGLPAVRFSVCDVWCEDVHPNMNHRLCVQNLCPYDKTPKRFSAGEARGAMVAKGHLTAVRFSVCDVWCEDVHPDVNHRLCVQNLCPYDKTPKAKLTSNDLLSA